MFTRDEILESINSLKVKLAPSKIDGAGVGLFAIVDIPKDTLIFKFKEDLEDHFIKYEEITDPKIREYFWGMTDGENGGFYIDVLGYMLYSAYYVNHSYEPNAFWTRRTQELYSIKDLKVGEELTTYYQPNERNF